MNQETRKWIMLAMLPVAVAVVAAAGIAFVSCSTPSKPVVALSAPVSGSQFIEGQEVIVQSTATDAKGVARVQLAVDNIVVSSDKLASPKTATTMIQKWQASSAGPHMLTVRAFNGDNVGSDPVNVTVMVLPKPAPTVAPTATSTPAPLPPGPCANNAALVADVTVPDGTVLAPGQQFNKIWRVLNSGSCPWNANYQFVFVGGEQMAAAGVLAVPYTNPGAITDLRVPMTAPTVPGPHVGRWQLRGDDGKLFGVLLDVRINVPNPSPQPSCSGSPSIASFTASATSIAPHSVVSLNWGLVRNANFVRVDPGIGSVATPGGIQVVVDTTTTFVMTAYCGTNVSTAQVTINVVNPTPAPTPVPPTPVPAFRVTGATASVNPSNFTGDCPGTFNYVGNITTNQAGVVTYRWIGSSSVAPSPVLVFNAPGAGSFALPGYQAQWGAKGNQWAQLTIISPNALSSNQAAFTNSCTDPKPAPPYAVILEPQNGFVGSTLVPVHVVFQGTGTSLRSISLYGNSQLLATQTAPGPMNELRGTYEWHPGPGRAELYAIAQDSAGQSSRSASVVGEIKPPAPAPTPIPTPVPPPTPTPPMDLSGVWDGESFTMNLQQMFGCMYLQCGYTGTFVDNRGGKGASGTITQGSFDGNSLHIVAAIEMPGAPQIVFNGSVSPDGRTIFGTWTDTQGESGHEQFRKQ